MATAKDSTKEVKTSTTTKKAAVKKPVKPNLSFVNGTVLPDSSVNDVDVAIEPISAKKDIDLPEATSDISNLIVPAHNILPVEESISTVPAYSEPELERVMNGYYTTKSEPETEALIKKLADSGHLSKNYVNDNFKDVALKGADKPFSNQFKNKGFNGKTNNGPYPSKREEEPAFGTYPEHMMNIARLIKNNAEIRRFTSLGILNYLLQKGEIKGGKRFVSFKWNKFVVKYDNLIKEYSYTEAFFLNCLVASFASFSSSAQKTIDVFTRKELNQPVDNVTDQGAIYETYEAIENR